jgi:MarR-like DNA-binding transcriptional regulator SgrR of sgrS sRNA
VPNHGWLIDLSDVTDELDRAAASPNQRELAAMTASVFRWNERRLELRLPNPEACLIVFLSSFVVNDQSWRM